MAARAPGTVVYDAGGIVRADVDALDALARLALAARRLGLELRVRNASQELRELVGLAGLAEALGLEPRRQAEEREERLGVEEERQLDDPPR